MKLIVLTVSAPFGPAEAFAAAELSAIRGRGVEVVLVPVRPRGEIVHAGFATAGDMVIRTSLLSPRVLTGAVSETLRSARAVVRAMMILGRSRSPRILAKNLLVLPKALWLADHARRIGADHIHAYWGSTPATVALIASAVSGIPFSFSAHAGDIDDNNLLLVKGRRATVVRVVSRHGEGRLRTLGIAPRTIRLIRLGVDLAPGGGSRRPLGREFTVLVPATLQPKKGHAVVVQALALLPPTDQLFVRVQLAGAGPEEAAIRRLGHELAVSDRLIFLGQLTHEELLRRYRESVDVVVLGSVTSVVPGRNRRVGGPDGRGNDAHEREAEGVPVSLIEAMAAGLPVIATPSGGTPELVDATTGILVPMRDPSALADAVRLLGMDRDLANRLGLAGRERVRADFDVERTAADLIAALEVDRPRA